MTATTDVLLGRHTVNGGLTQPFPVATGKEIKAGWLVLIGRRGTASAGKVKAVETGDSIEEWDFLGVADSDGDDTGSKAWPNQDGEVLVRIGAEISEVILASVAAGDIGKVVYAIDNQTATLTPAATAAFPMGKIANLADRSNRCNVKLIEFGAIRYFHDVQGPQTLDMDDATHTLILVGTATAAQTHLRGDVLFVDPNSGGAAEQLVMPPEAQSKGLKLTIVNTGGEDITVRNSANDATIGTVEDGDIGIAACDGTAWRVLVNTTT